MRRKLTLLLVLTVCGLLAGHYGTVDAQNVSTTASLPGAHTPEGEYGDDGAAAAQDPFDYVDDLLSDQSMQKRLGRYSDPSMPGEYARSGGGTSVDELSNAVNAQTASTPPGLPGTSGRLTGTFQLATPGDDASDVIDHVDQLLSSDKERVEVLPVQPGRTFQAESQQMDVALENAVHAVLTVYQQNNEQATRTELESKLAQLTERQFDLQHAVRDREIAELEAKVKKLRQQLDRRAEAKSEIVRLRVDQLLRAADGLGWEEQTNTGGRGGSGRNPYSSGYSQPAR